MKKNQKHEIVQVDWTDTASNSGWRSKDWVAKWGRKPTQCSNVGFFIEKNKHNVVLASMADIQDEEQTYNDYTRIPVGCIEKIKRLKS